MKLIYTTLVAMMLSASTWAQSPEKMSYQAVVRDANSNLVTAQSVGMQISVLKGSATGTAVYVETQSPTTNENGLISLEIGTGTVVNGDFTTIDWASDTYFIKTETDPTGGTDYSITGTSQLLSVPYALHAKTAETITGTITESDPIFGASIAIGITASDTINWNNRIQDTDTQLDVEGVTALGFVAGAHTVDTDTQLDLAGVTALGFVAGAHTVDTDTQLDSTGVASLGYVAGAHTVNTDTQLDVAGVTALGFVTGEHTVDTDTQLDSAGVTALGFVAGGHAVDTNTQLDSTGVASLGYVAGPHSGTTSIQDADANTSIQVEETANEDIIRFDIGGTEQWIMTGTRLEPANTGFSVFIGPNAGANDDLTNNQNVFIGENAGTSNTTGALNTATGSQALNDNTTGIRNTAYGVVGLKANTTGFNNTATGFAALAKNTTGALNTANGYEALLSNVTGSNNTAFGYQAGRTVTGSGNVMLGYQAGDAETGSNTLYIDNSNTTNPLLYGDFAADSLVVNGDLTATGEVRFSNGAAAGNVLTSDANGVATWQAAGAHTVDTKIDSTGIASLGFVAGAHTTEVDGSITNEIQNLTSVLNEGNDAGMDSLVNVGQLTIGSSTPTAGAAVDINSTTGALILPRLTTTQRDNLSASIGMLIYNTNENKFQGYKIGEATMLTQPNVTNYTGNNSAFGQSFTAASTGKLTAIKFNLALANSGFTLNIYEGEGMGGNLIHTEGVSPNANINKLVLASSVQLTSSNVYTLEFTIGNYQLSFSNANPYAGGQMYTNGAANSGSDLFLDLYYDGSGWVDLH